MLPTKWSFYDEHLKVIKKWNLNILNIFEMNLQKSFFFMKYTTIFILQSNCSLLVDKLLVSCSYLRSFALQGWTYRFRLILILSVLSLVHYKFVNCRCSFQDQSSHLKHLPKNSMWFETWPSPLLGGHVMHKYHVMAITYLYVFFKGKEKRIPKCKKSSDHKHIQYHMNKTYVPSIQP